MSRSLYSAGRQDERIRVILPVTVRIGWEGSVVVHASTVDLSERGVRIRANVPFRFGQDILLKVDSNDTEAKAYRVVWIRGTPTAGGSMHEMGLELRV